MLKLTVLRCHLVHFLEVALLSGEVVSCKKNIDNAVGFFWYRDTINLALMK